MPNTAFTRIRTRALAIAAVLFIGSQASAEQDGRAVTVVNTPLPVTVTNPSTAGTPVAFTLGFPPSVGQTSVFAVPAAKLLVIDYVSGQCAGLLNFGAGNTPLPVIPPNPFFTTVTGQVTNQHAIAIPFNPIPSNTSAPIGTWELGQLVKVYADPGTNVTLTVPPSTPTAQPSCTLAFSGQLMNP